MTPEKIICIVANQFKVSEDSLSLDTNFKKDLNADSIDMIELAMTLESEFNIPEPAEGENLPVTNTIRDLIDYLNTIIN